MHIQSISDPKAQKPIRVFEIRNEDCKIRVSSLGASIAELITGGVDIILGYKNEELQGSTKNPVYFGAVVGRVANRIAKGTMHLNNQEYVLETNSPPNHLHGGSEGLSHLIWDKAAILPSGNGVEFRHTSPDGDQGYPGSIEVSVTYTLNAAENGNVLRAEFRAELIDRNEGLTAPINLAQHSYFNLAGGTKDGILDHSLSIDADHYTPLNEFQIPTRQVEPLDDDTVMDWRTPRTIREGMKDFGIRRMGLSESVVEEHLQDRSLVTSNPYGFDHNYVVRSESDNNIGLKKVAQLSIPARSLTVYSTAPGVQVYTANYLDPKQQTTLTCKGTYAPWEGICLETQCYPDSVSEWPLEGAFGKGQCFLLRPGGESYSHVVEYYVQEYKNDAASAASIKNLGGSDTEGRKFASIQEMWAAQDMSSWYCRAADWYEGNCGETVDGVLGGLGHLSPSDLKGSRAFVDSLTFPSTSSTVACECGAGIGRVTKGLLLDVCDRCDLVESSERLLYSSPDFIGERSSRCRFYCNSLQEWEPAAKKYTLIWIQWVLCYLTDVDIVAFLTRCRLALVEGGYIVLKENTCADEHFIVDVDDASVTRSVEYWLDLIDKAGLKVVKQTWQDDFPDDIFPVPMMALRPK